MKEKIKRYTKFLILFLTIICAIIAVRSGIFLEKKDLHKENFVNLNMTEFLVDSCDTGVNCDETAIPIVESSASGFIVWKLDGLSYILTAGHFCNHEIVENYSFPGFSIKSEVTISDFQSTDYDAEIIFIDDSSDLCLLRSTIKRDIKTIRFSSMPKIGEKVYAISSPLGISENGVLLHFDGFFSGCDDIGLCYYTIPATSGSSGSIVFDRAGYVIGMIQMTPTHFRSVSLGVGSPDILSFLRDASDHLKINLIPF